MSRGRPIGSMRSRRTTVWTSTSAPAHSSSRPGARHGVAGDDHRPAAVVDPVADGRADGRVVGGRGGDPHRSLLEDHARLDLGDGGRRSPGQVVVVGQAVADVRLQHRLDRPPAASAVPAGPYTGSGLGVNDMTHRMVKTSLRSVMWSLCRWVRNTARKAPAPEADGGGPHEHTPPAVEQQIADRGADQGRRPGPLGVGDRAAAAQDDYLQGAPRIVRGQRFRSLGRPRGADRPAAGPAQVGLATGAVGWRRPGRTGGPTAGGWWSPPTGPRCPTPAARSSRWWSAGPSAWSARRHRLRRWPWV